MLQNDINNTRKANTCSDKKYNTNNICIYIYVHINFNRKHIYMYNIVLKMLYNKI